LQRLSAAAASRIWLRDNFRVRLAFMGYAEFSIWKKDIYIAW